jgi:hypothetical protein
MSAGSPNERGGVGPPPLSPELMASATMVSHPVEAERIRAMQASKAANRVYGARGAAGGGSIKLGPDRKGDAR